MVRQTVNPEVKKLKQRQRAQRYRSILENQKKKREHDRTYRQKKREQIRHSVNQRRTSPLVSKENEHEQIESNHLRIRAESYMNASSTAEANLEFADEFENGTPFLKERCVFITRRQ